MTQDMDACKHLRIQSWFTAEGEPVPLWSCAACQVKFEPLVLSAAPAGEPADVRDALRYRWLRDAPDVSAVLSTAIPQKRWDTEIDAALGLAAPAGEPAAAREIERLRAALDKIAESNESDDPRWHLVQIARDALAAWRATP